MKAFLKVEGVTGVEKVTSAEITHYYDYLQDRPNQRRAGGLSSSYINHQVYALRLFFKWLHQSGRISIDPISGMEFERVTVPERGILSISEIRKLYEVSEKGKERAMLGLFYGCGLRRSEGESLNVSDVDFRGGLLYVRSGKGAKRRVVPIGAKVKGDLKSYCDHHRFGSRNEPAFICNIHGRRMRGDRFNHILKELLERAGLSDEYSLHSLRHSVAWPVVQVWRWSGIFWVIPI